MASVSTAYSRPPAKLLVIQAGKAYYSNLGLHYGPLVKHTMGLVPLPEYTVMSTSDQQKYSPIQALPQGHAIALALIDASFQFSANHMDNLWAHGPHCLHIYDIIRFPTSLPLRGMPGIFAIKPISIADTILGISVVQQKINQWRIQFQFKCTAASLRAICIFQPFAEATVRGLKTIENRSSNLMCIGPKQSKSQRKTKQILQCRLCIPTASAPIDWLALERVHLSAAQTLNSTLPHVSDDFEINYHKTASVTQCECQKKMKQAEAKVKKMKKRKKMSEESTVSGSPTRKKRKLNTN